MKFISSVTTYWTRFNNEASRNTRAAVYTVLLFGLVLCFAAALVGLVSVVMALFGKFGMMLMFLVFIFAVMFVTVRDHV